MQMIVDEERLYFNLQVGGLMAILLINVTLYVLIFHLSH